MKKLSLFTIITSVFIFCNCEKEKEITNKTTSSPNENNEEPIYNTISNSIEKYKYKTGSYWKYYNSNLDTSEIINLISIESGNINTQPPVHGTAANIWEEFYKINYSSSIGQTYNDFIMSDFIRRNGGGEYGELGQPIYLVNKESGYEFNGMSIIEKIPAISVNGNSFNDITKIKITADNQYQEEFEYDTYLYFCDSIGIIKKEYWITPDSIEIWNIQEWNIIR